jgi:hypothetical protein
MFSLILLFDDEMSFITNSFITFAKSNIAANTTAFCEANHIGSSARELTSSI